MTKCIICERHPAMAETGICHNCTAKIESDCRKSQPVKPKHYLTYRGIVVGLYPNGDDKLHPQLLQRGADHLPKGKTIDLNVYLDGFTRDEVKRFKACVKSLAHV